VSPWSPQTRRDFGDRAELRALFESEQLPTTLDMFFDQRFIDFLHSNPDQLSSMHWRQFEGLIGERLRRAGLRVEIGPGRNDDGVDVRAWDGSALLLVQCKREKTKISKVVVKALAADIAFEGATAGLVVTSSSWSPGARETVSARGYPIIEAGRETVTAWLNLLRTPVAGAWLSE